MVLLMCFEWDDGVLGCSERVGSGGWWRCF